MATEPTPAEGKKAPAKTIAPRIPPQAPPPSPPTRASEDMATLVSAIKELATVVAQNQHQVHTVLEELRKPATVPEATALPTHNQAALLQAAINHSKLSRHVFGLIIVPDNGIPERRSFETVEELLEALSPLVHTPAFAYPFVGEPFFIKKVNGVHCLTTSQGDFPIPTVHAEEETIEVDGWLGGTQAPPLADPEVM